MSPLKGPTSTGGLCGPRSWLMSHAHILWSLNLFEESNDSPEKNAQIRDALAGPQTLLKPVPRSCPGSMDPGEEALLLA